MSRRRTSSWLIPNFPAKKWISMAVNALMPSSGQALRIRERSPV